MVPLGIAADVAIPSTSCYFLVGAQLSIMAHIVAFRHKHVIFYEFTWFIPCQDVDSFSTLRSDLSRWKQR